MTHDIKTGTPTWTKREQLSRLAIKAMGWVYSGKETEDGVRHAYVDGGIDRLVFWDDQVDPSELFCWDPSRSESDAMKLQFKLGITVTPGPQYNWRAGICNWSQSGEINAVGLTNGTPWVEGATPMEAIYKCALRSIGIEI